MKDAVEILKTTRVPNPNDSAFDQTLWFKVEGQHSSGTASSLEGALNAQKAASEEL